MTRPARLVRVDEGYVSTSSISRAMRKIASQLAASIGMTMSPMGSATYWGPSVRGADTSWGRLRAHIHDALNLVLHRHRYSSPLGSAEGYESLAKEVKLRAARLALK